jgi:hypothetical protein
MTEAWKDDNCAAMKAHYAVYSVPEASALWCGVDKDQVKKILSEVVKLSETGFGRGVWLHDDIPCLEPRSRAIAEAILSGALPHGREDGVTVDSNDVVAAERRRVLGRDLKCWMELEFPNEKPEFLFDDIERNSHSEITLEAYQALQADRDALKLRVEKAKTAYTQLRNEKTIVENELKEVKKQLSGCDHIKAIKNSDELSTNDYWIKLMRLATKAINEYPIWRGKQRKVQKAGNLQDWLVNDCHASTREAEILKKILSDKFQELRK